MSYGKTIKKYRLERKMTQVELAKKAGLTDVWISHLENERRKPSLETAIKLADALLITLDDLAGR